MFTFIKLISPTFCLKGFQPYPAGLGVIKPGPWFGKHQRDLRTQPALCSSVEFLWRWENYSCLVSFNFRNKVFQSQLGNAELLLDSQFLLVEDLQSPLPGEVWSLVYDVDDHRVIWTFAALTTSSLYVDWGLSLLSSVEQQRSRFWELFSSTVKCRQYWTQSFHQTRDRRAIR